jgi:hypothetical protein
MKVNLDNYGQRDVMSYKFTNTISKYSTRYHKLILPEPRFIEAHEAHDIALNSYDFDTSLG